MERIVIDISDDLLVHIIDFSEWAINHDLELELTKDYKLIIKKDTCENTMSENEPLTKSSYRDYTPKHAKVQVEEMIDI